MDDMHFSIFFPLFSPGFFLASPKKSIIFIYFFIFYMIFKHNYKFLFQF
jgi:hypothetical protein